MKLKNIKLIVVLTLIGIGHAACGAIFEFHNKTNQNIYLAIQHAGRTQKYTITPGDTQRILSTGCLENMAISETGHHLNHGDYNWIKMDKTCLNAAFDIMGTHGNIWISSSETTAFK